ncbi:MAG TPA: hypothetical protein VHS07_06220 [Candidatus Binataceae bacterium]|jgi:hypothetical protein|nr:hypothetical protein [Candidatus Binataceae bacterium]
MPTRIKSSFIYLANAVNDLRGNWATLALVLAPLVLLSALCVLPDAFNLQHLLVHKFEPGVRSVGWIPTQTPYPPEMERAQAEVAHWVIRIRVLRIALTLITSLVILVTLCMLKRIAAGQVKARILNEAIEIYRDALARAPAFYWILILQLMAVAVGFVLLLLPGLLAMVWLSFGEYALIFDDQRSWPALFRSRDLIRGRFFKVAVRLLVFSAFWSGFNSWVGGTFFGISLLIGAIGVWTGALWATIFVFALVAWAVFYATIAFFITAGARLYQDLKAIAAEQAESLAASAQPATAPLVNLNATAAD